MTPGYLPEGAERDAVESLAANIRETAAHIAAGQARFLQLVARLDAEQGWASFNCTSTEHFLDWQCGIDRRAGAEMVRVARALEGLPLVKAAFARGEISFRQVRLIVGIATPETEQTLVEWTRHGTATHLQRIARSYKRVVEAQPAADGLRSFRERHLTWEYDWDGMLDVRARLTPDCGASFVAAVEGAAEELRADETEEFEREPGQRMADALGLVAERALGAGPVHAAERHLVIVHLDAATLSGGDGRAHLDDGRPIAAATAQRIACDCGMIPVIRDDQGRILDLGRKTRRISPALRRALRLRDAGCVFPGCGNSVYVDGHHLVGWWDGGATKLQNLASLCRFHHTLLHNGAFTIERGPDGEFLFRRPDGRTIDRPPLKATPHDLQ